jgi:hypothetical protein
MNIVVNLLKVLKVITSKGKTIPVLPTIGTMRNRLVHTTPLPAESFFKYGLKIGHHGNIESYVRAYGNESIPLVMPVDNFCSSIGFFMREGKYASGSAIVIDMPEIVYRIFRSIQCTEKVVPKEFIRGAVKRDGTWIPNPNFDESFVYNPSCTKLVSNRRTSLKI